MSFLAQADVTWTDVLMLPLLAVIFGMFVYVVGYRKELAGDKGVWRWLGVALFVLGCYVGWSYFYNMFGGSADALLYRAQIEGGGPNKKLRIAHYAAFLLPFASLLVALFLEWRLKRMGSDLD